MLVALFAGIDKAPLNALIGWLFWLLINVLQEIVGMN